MRRIIGSILICLNCSCASISPPREAAVYEPEGPARKIASLIESQADVCWKSMGTIVLPDAIQVFSKEKIDGSFQIHASRVGQGYVMDPFIIVTVSELTQEKSAVRVLEGDFGCGFTKCESVYFVHDVERWLDGDQTCGSRSYSERRKRAESLRSH